MLIKKLKKHHFNRPKGGGTRAFTLVEIVIVLVIIWILSSCIIQSYMTVSQIAFHIEQKKNLTEEALMITQILESIASDATIDYEKYKISNAYSELLTSSWYTNILYLTWNLWSWASIYTTWNCLELEWWNWNWEFNMYANSWCQLILEQTLDGKAIQTPLIATNSDDFKKIIISSAKFRVIPFDSPNNLTNNPQITNWEQYINNLWRPAFYLFLHLYSPYYQPAWKNAIDQPLQLFFNLNES